jgi:hypothetical protein
MARNDSDYVLAKDAAVIVVGARPPQYGTVTVIDNKTGNPVEIPNQQIVVDEGDEGTTYVFRQGQRVHRSHPAVADCPGQFVSAEDADALMIQGAS